MRLPSHKKRRAGLFIAVSIAFLTLAILLPFYSGAAGVSAADCGRYCVYLPSSSFSSYTYSNSSNYASSVSSSSTGTASSQADSSGSSTKATSTTSSASATTVTAYSSTSTTYPVQGTVVWKFVQAPNTVGSYFVMTISGIILDPILAPTQVLVSYSIVDNGVLYSSGACTLNHLTGSTYVPCTITVPYYASASALLIVSYKNGHGQIVAGMIEDPLAEPEWK